MHCTVVSNSSNDTEKLASKIGSRLRGGEVIELVSDLGGGKTTFVRGLAKGFGSKDRVASPTFTLSRLYKAGDRELHHFDFYRLAEAGIVAHEIKELAGEKNTVVAVEWAEVVQHVLPDRRLTIEFKPTGDDSREINFDCSKELDYLLEDIC